MFNHMSLDWYLVDTSFEYNEEYKTLVRSNQEPEYKLKKFSKNFIGSINKYSKQFELTRKFKACDPTTWRHYNITLLIRCYIVLNTNIIYPEKFYCCYKYTSDWLDVGTIEYYFPEFLIKRFKDLIKPEQEGSNIIVYNKSFRRKMVFLREQIFRCLCAYQRTSATNTINDINYIQISDTDIYKCFI